MCGGPPDTSAQQQQAADQAAADERRAQEQRAAQDAEAQRQLDAENANAQALRDQQHKDASLAQAQAADIAAQQLYAQEQTQAVQKQYQDQQIAQQQAEQAAQKAAADKRAADVVAYTNDRNARAQSLTDQINSAYSKFDDNYFNDFKTNFVNYYKPQIDTQYADAARANTLAMANQGILDSSAAGRNAALLAGRKADEESQIASQANSGADTLRSQVAGQRSSLLQQALDASVIGPIDAPTDVATGMAGIDQNAAAFSGNINGSVAGIKAPALTPLGSVFSGVAGSGGTSAGTPGGAGALGGAGDLSAFITPSSASSGSSARVIQ